MSIACCPVLPTLSTRSFKPLRRLQTKSLRANRPDAKRTSSKQLMQNNSSIDPRARIGHVRLKVANLEGASDHGVSEALYLRDPDQNGVELYRDCPPEQWPRTTAGQLAMFTRPLDLRRLLAETKAQGGTSQAV